MDELPFSGSRPSLRFRGRLKPEMRPSCACSRCLAIRTTPVLCTVATESRLRRLECVRPKSLKARSTPAEFAMIERRRMASLTSPLRPVETCRGSFERSHRVQIWTRSGSCQSRPYMSSDNANCKILACSPFPPVQHNFCDIQAAFASLRTPPCVVSSQGEHW